MLKNSIAGEISIDKYLTYKDASNKALYQEDLRSFKKIDLSNEEIKHDLREFVVEPAD